MYYDAVCVQKHSKTTFRDLWCVDEKNENRQLDLVESEFRSSSGSIYDFMVAQAQGLASKFKSNRQQQRTAETDTITPFELALVILYEPFAPALCFCKPFEHVRALG
jgi:hypothetical protein